MDSSSSSCRHVLPADDVANRNGVAQEELTASATGRGSMNPEIADVSSSRRRMTRGLSQSSNNDSPAEALLTLSGRPPPTSNYRLLARGAPEVALGHPGLSYGTLPFSGAVALPFVSGHPAQHDLLYSDGRRQPPHLAIGGASVTGPQPSSSQSAATTTLPEPASSSNPASIIQQAANRMAQQNQQKLLLWSHHHQHQQHLANLQQSLVIGGGSGGVAAAAASRHHGLSARLGLFGSAQPPMLSSNTAAVAAVAFHPTSTSRLTSTAASTPNSATSSSIKNAEHHDRAPVVLYVDRDGMELSPYQCLVRQQIEVFQQPSPESKFQNKEITTQGRNRPIVPGQVGLRCRHCCGRGVESSSSSPSLRRPRGKYAMLFPSTLLGAYQSAQNMANTHLLKTCTMIPDLTRKELVRKRTRDTGQKTCKSAYGGGRNYWADGLRELGVVDSEDRRLRFSSSFSSPSSTLAPTTTMTTSRSCPRRGSSSRNKS